jgi:hypothetical protein
MALLDMQGMEAVRGPEDGDRMGADSEVSLLGCGESCMSQLLCL